MSIKYKFFTIPIRDPGDIEIQMNKFLQSVQVMTVDREFVADGENSFWCMAIEYQPKTSSESRWQKKGKIDYREVLSPEDFDLYDKLRYWRKIKAAENAVQMYTIFTNDQLAKIAEGRIVTKTGLKEIEGVGEARSDKYGDDVIAIVKQAAKPEKTDEK